MDRFSNEQRALWQRICTHPLVRPELGRDFRAQLAAEQGWNLAEADAAIEEYRRFCFLAVAGGINATPSSAVDQVWHLHLTHSRDYWQQFCPEVLGSSLHHLPSTGGAAELHRHQAQYAATLAAYEHYFGTPPSRWWPATSVLFDHRPRWSWVDRSRYWLLPRPSWPRAGWSMAVAAIALVLPGLALALPSNPLDWTGGPFLALFFGGALAMSLIGWLLRRQLAQTSVPVNGANLGMEELAYMAGGDQRLTDAVVAQGLAQGSLEMEGSRRLRSGSASAQGMVAAAQAQVVRATTPSKLAKALRPQCDQVAEQLISRGLVLDTAQAWRVQLLSAAPLLGWIAFGAVKISVGLERQRPVAFLVILCIVFGLIALTLLFSRPRLTSAGRQALGAQRLRHSRVSRAPQVDNGELGLAVALAGTSVMATTAYAGYHELRSPSSSSSCSSDGGGGSSCGGGGGGGCGGCGGD